MKRLAIDLAVALLFGLAVFAIVFVYCLRVDGGGLG